MHVHGTLAALAADARHVAHFCVGKIIFVGMGLVHDQGIHAQFLKIDHIVLLLRLKQLVIPKLQVLSENLHLL